VIGFVSCAIWPTAVTRALSARDERVVRRQYAFSSISFMIRFLIPCFMGLAAYVFLTQSGAVMLDDGAFRLGDGEYTGIQAFPVMLRELLPVGALGLITAAMLAAFMSTHDSYLLCWSSVIARDVIAPVHGSATAAQQLLWTRIGIVVIGLWVLFWGIAYTPTQAVWEYLGITGAIYFTGAIVVLIAGLYWKRASSVGAALALCSGFTALLGLGPIKTRLGIEDWGAEWIGLSTLGLAVLAMIVGSLFFPDRDQSHAEGT
jgi:solute:Na+ symporter, SSS family